MGSRTYSSLQIWYPLLVIPALLLPTLVGSLLEPISDDYCYVVSVNQSGVLGFTAEQTTTWSGALVTNAFAAIFGWLQQTSFQFAYALLLLITFSLTYLAFTLLLANTSRVGIKRQFWGILLLSVLLGLTFIASNFGSPLGLNSHEFPYGYTTIGWGAAILSQYLPNLVLFIAAGLLILQRTTVATWVSPSVLLLSAVLPLLSIQAGVAWVTFTLAASLLSVRQQTHKKMVLFLPTILGTIFTVLNVVSPGSRNRRTQISDGGNGDLIEGFVRSVAASLDSLFSGLTVIGLISGAGIMLLLAKNHFTRLAHARLYLLLAASVLFSVTVTDTFGAFEPWHQTGWRFSIFALAVLVGMRIGTHWRALSRLSSGRGPQELVRPTALGIWMLFLLIQFGLLVSFLTERAAAIEAGDARPVAWIADTEVEWIRYCSESIRN
jgi:hypothetical protein